MCDKTFNRKNILNKNLQSEHDVVMHDYEYSDDEDDAPPPPMERASVDLKDLNDVRAHEEIATPSYSKWNEHPYHVFKGAHTSSKSKPVQTSFFYDGGRTVTIWENVLGIETVDDER